VAVRNLEGHGGQLMQPLQIPMPCDHTSVGAMVRNGNTGEFLTFTGATQPGGVAGPAGHIDDHGGPQAAIIAAVQEGAGLTVMSEQVLAVMYRPGACRRPMGNLGHDWWLWDVRVEGDLAQSARETRDARWRAPAELQQLARRTIDYARGRIGTREFEADPGLEPVWLDWFGIAGAVTASVDDQWAVDRLLRGTR